MAENTDIESELEQDSPTPEQPMDEQLSREEMPSMSQGAMEQELALLGINPSTQASASMPAAGIPPDPNTFGMHQESQAPTFPEAKPVTNAERATEYVKAKQAAGEIPSSIAAPSVSQNDLIAQMMKKYGMNNPETNDDALKAAQALANKNRTGTNVSRAFDTMATVANGIKPDDAFWNNVSAQAGQPVADLEARRALQAQNLGNDTNVLKMVDAQLGAQSMQNATDPNSNTSKATRAVLLKYHPDLATVPGFNEMSANDAKAYLTNTIEAEAKMASSRELAMARIQDLKNNRNQTNMFKTAGLQSKYLNDLDPSKASSRSGFGIAGQSSMAADRALGILDNPVVTKQDAASVAADINRLVSQSTSLGGSEHQNYVTLQGKANDLMQQAEASPENVLSPEIRQHLKQVVQQMKDVSDKAINTHRLGVRAAHPGDEALIDSITANLGQKTGGMEAQQPAPQVTTSAPSSNQELRQLKDGRTGIFDRNTKKFLGYQ